MSFKQFPSPARFGGLDENENPQDIAPEDLTIAQNVWRRGGALSTRPGTQRETGTTNWDDTVTVGAGVGDPCQGLFDVATQSDSVRHLIGIFGGVPYVKHDLAMTNTPVLAISATNDDFWTFAMGRGSGTVKMYMVGGDITSPDPLISWVPDAAGTLTLADVDATGWGGTYPGARYIWSWSNYGFIAGMEGTGTDDNRMVVRYSALSNMDVWPAANVMGGAFAIGGLASDGDQFTTGFGEYQDNDGKWLLVMTNKAIYPIKQQASAFVPFTMRDSVATGCVGQRAFVSLGVDSGDAVYLSDKGIHSLRQSQEFGAREDRFLSWKIRETFNTINKARLKYAVGAYDEKNGVVLFAVPTGSNTENDLILALDIRDATSRETDISKSGLSSETARWYKWQTTLTNHHMAALVSARDRTTGEAFVYGANYKGDVFRFTTSVYDDLGTGYPIDVAGRWEDFGAPSVKKVFGSAHLWVGPNADYNPRFHLEYDFGEGQSRSENIDLTGSGAKWDAATWDQSQWSAEGGSLSLRRKRIYVRGHAEVARWRIQHSGLNEPTFLSRITQDVDAIGKDAGDANAA